MTSSQKSDSDNHPLPHGIRLLAYARAIRWVGWGFGEALIPVFIVSFSHTFAQMGLFSSTVKLAALISLPVIGMMADRMPAKHLVLASLVLYPLVGINYFLAGSLVSAVFIVLARAINGVTWELENVGIETYYRRTAHHTKIATLFGYLDTWSNAAWIFAALVGMGLVSFIPIHYLFLGISPFALVAYLIVKRAPHDKVGISPPHIKQPFFYSYGKVISEWRTWNVQLRLLSALVLFSSIISALTDFFIPIEAYLNGANLPMVVLLAIFGAIPALFGYNLGRLADIRSKTKLISYGLLIVAITMCGVVIFPQYWFKLGAIFVMGIVMELFSVIKGSLVTTLGPSETYGIRGSAFESIVTFGDLAAPLLLGIAMDVLGFSNLLATIAGISISFGFIYYLKQKIETSKQASYLSHPSP